MSALVFFIILIIALGLYGYGKFSSVREHVIAVEAGPSGEADSAELKKYSFYDTRKNIKDSHGNLINTSKMIRVIVKGNCMQPKGISDGSQLYIQPIDLHKSFKEQVHQGSILLIHIKDKDIKKLRILERINPNGLLETYRFEGENRRDSSKPHKPKDVLGVVKYLV